MANWNTALKTFLIIFTNSEVSGMLSAPFKIRLNGKLGHVGLYSSMNKKTPELKCFLCKEITSWWLHWPLTASPVTGLEKSLEIWFGGSPAVVCVLPVSWWNSVQVCGLYWSLLKWRWLTPHSSRCSSVCGDIGHIPYAPAKTHTHTHTHTHSLVNQGCCFFLGEGGML